MSQTISTAVAQQFSANVRMLAEQKSSYLRRACMIEEVTGDAKPFETLGSATAANLVTERHGNTPLDEQTHGRRWLYTKTYDKADLLDKADKPTILIDPMGKYTIRHAGAMGRAMDDEILSALGRSVAEGVAGGTITALPAAQKIASSSVGLTIAKLIEAKRLLDAAEVDADGRYFVCSSTELAQLLSNAEVTSQDFNTVRVLVNGEINTYLGFQFIRSERLETSGGARLNYAFHSSAVILGIAAEPTSEVNIRPDKRNAQQLYTWGSWGALRIEDKCVVQVACV